MNERTHIDLFTGLGGFSLAARANGVRTVAQCECEEFLAKGLETIWQVPVCRDVRQFRGGDYRGAWLLTAGVPCQPASRAGKQRGQSDDRWLWPEALRVTAEAQPTWALFENVVGLADVGLDGIIAQVAGLGYEVGLVRIPACAVDSPQDRDRFWIVAHTTSPRQAPSDKTGNSEQASSGGRVRELQRAPLLQPLANGAEPGHQERPSLAGNQGDGRPTAQRASEGGSVADGEQGTGNRRPDESQRRPEGRIALGRDDQSGAVADSQEQPQPAGLCAGEPGGLWRERSGDFVSPWSEFEWVPMPNRAGEIEIRRAPVGLYELAYGIPSRLPGPIRSRLIAALGNAIVWKIATEIIKAMIEAED